MGNAEGLQPAFGSCWTWAAVEAAKDSDSSSPLPRWPEKAQVGPDGGSGQPEAMLPGDLHTVYSGLRAKALFSQQ